MASQAPNPFACPECFDLRFPDKPSHDRYVENLKRLCKCGLKRTGGRCRNYKDCLGSSSNKLSICRFYAQGLECPMLPGESFGDVHLYSFHTRRQCMDGTDDQPCESWHRLILPDKRTEKLAPCYQTRDVFHVRRTCKIRLVSGSCPKEDDGCPGGHDHMSARQ